MAVPICRKFNFDIPDEGKCTMTRPCAIGEPNEVLLSNAANSFLWKELTEKTSTLKAVANKHLKAPRIPTLAPSKR